MKSRHLVDLHVGADGVTDGLAVTGDNVDDTRGEAGLVDKGTHTDGGQRGKFGRLDDNGVAGSESRAEFPCKHEQGEVPWDDLAL